MDLEEIQNKATQLIAKLNDASTQLKNTEGVTKEQLELIERYTKERDNVTNLFKDLDNANTSH